MISFIYEFLQKLFFACMDFWKNVMITTKKKKKIAEH